MNNALDLCRLIERNAPYAPDNTAIHFEVQTQLRQPQPTDWRIARAFKSQLDVQRGDRIAILSFSRPNYLGLQCSMRKHRPILSRSRTAPNQASLSASPRRSKFTIVGITIPV